MASSITCSILQPRTCACIIFHHPVSLHTTRDMEQMILLSLVLDWLKSLLYCRITALSREFLQCFSDVIYFLFMSMDECDLEVWHSEPCICSSDKGVSNVPQGELSNDDIKVVVEKLGMIGPGNEKCDDYGSIDEALRLLEEKEASLEELEEAFYVFDRNEDGFITPVELWSVMRRLGLAEGARLEDCKRMIAAFDEDGNGKISFSEFKSMLENAS